MANKFTKLRGYISTRSRYRYISIISLSVLAFLAVSAFVLSRQILNPAGRPSNSQAAGEVRINQKVSDQLLEQSKITALVYLTTSTKSEASQSESELQTQRNNIRADQQLLINELKGMNYKLVHQYTTAPLVALELDSATLEKLKSLKGLVKRIEENTTGKPLMQQSRKVVGADVVENNGWSVPNTSNMAVVVIDTGVDYTAPYLMSNGVSKVVDGACFGDECPNVTGAAAAVPCSWTASNGPTDLNCKHGTFVAGVVAGGDSGTGDRLAGISPDLKIIAIRDVTQYAGYAQFTKANMLAALDWVVQKVDAYKKGNYPYNIVAVNMSFFVDENGQTAYCDDQYADNPDFQTLYDHGVAVVSATGNYGWIGYLFNPTCVSTVIPVGSTDKTGQISSFSHTATFAKNLMLAPGGKGETAGPGENIKSSIPGGEFVESFGTSFSAPQVAAAYATLRAAAPTASLDSLTEALKSTGTIVKDGRNGNDNGSFPLIRIDKAVAKIRGADLTTACSSSLQNTFITCSHPSGDTVLGASTVDGESHREVLQASTGQYSNMALVTVSYSVGSNPDTTVSRVQYCSTQMVRVNSVSALGGGMKTDMFYLLNPPSSPSGKCEALASFTKIPGERMLSMTLLSNIDSNNPLAGVTSAQTNGSYTATPIDVKITSNGPKDSLMLCGYSHYSEQSLPPTPNYVTPTGTTRSLFKYEDATYLNPDNNRYFTNVWGGIVAGTQRTAIGDTDIMWRFAKSQPWSAICANFNVKPIVVSAPPTPAPLPSVDIKANGSNGPVSVVSGTAVTLSWSSSNVSSCSATGGWTGNKSVTGSASIVPLSSLTYTINCVGPNNAQASDSVTVNVTGTTLNFKINDGQKDIYDYGLISVIGATNTTFTWSYNGTASSCTATTTSANSTIPNWTGTKAKSGTQIVPISFGGPYTFKLTCGTLSKVIQISTATPGPTPPPTPQPIPSPKPGLTGEYYDNEDFTGLLFSRTDSSINYNWSLNSPDSRIGVDTFSTRWTGSLKVPATGAYTFYMTLDDGARLWIDNTLVLDKWGYSSHNGVEVTSSAVNLSQGSHAIKVEYHEGASRARILLSWSGPGIPKQIIPNGALLNMIPLSSTMGLLGSYFDNEDFTNLRINRFDPNISFDWGSSAPDQSVASDTFSVRWSGGIIVPTTGNYTFYMLGDDGMRIYIDEQLVLDKWGYSSHTGKESASNGIPLTAGNHSFRAEYHDGSGNAKATLSWSGPGISKQIIPPSSFRNSYTPPVGVIGEYFNTVNFTGSKITRTDPAINFNWGRNTPLSGINADNFSVRWTGYIHTPSQGSYVFYTEADDGIRVWVDGTLVMDKWSWSSHLGAEQTSKAITLSAGTHALQVEHREGGGGAKAIIKWSGPSFSKTILPIYQN